MSTRAPRPVAVTLLVVLLWIQALAGMAFGLFLTLAHDDADVVQETGRSTDVLLTLGIVLLVLGALSALFATLLGRGSGFARWVVGFLAACHLAGAVYAFVALDSVTRSSALTEGAVSIAVLYILFGARGTDDFFRR